MMIRVMSLDGRVFDVSADGKVFHLTEEETKACQQELLDAERQHWMLCNDQSNACLPLAQ